MLTLDLTETVSQSFAEILIGGQNGAIKIKLDDCPSASDCVQFCFVIIIAGYRDHDAFLAQRPEFLRSMSFYW
jgi:hypothetical protein